MIPAAKVAARVVSTAAGQIFAEPVRSGRIRLRAWSRPLQVVIIVSLALYVFITVQVLASGLLMHLDSSTLMLGLSVWAWPALSLSVWASMSLLFLATLQLGILFRVLSWLLLLVPHLILSGGLVFAVGSLMNLGMAGFLILLGVVITSVAGLVMLIMLAVTRPGGVPTASTLIIAPLALAGTYLLPQLGVGAVAMAHGTEISRAAAAAPGVTLLVLVGVALPLAVAAGTAFSQIAINACTWAFLALRREVRRPVWAPIGVVLGVAVTLHSVYEVRQHDVTVQAAVLTLGHGALCFALSAFGLAQARQIAGFAVPRPTALTEELGRVSMRLGLLLGCWYLPLVLDLVLPLPSWLGENGSHLASCLMGLAAGWWAVLAVRRGQPVLATLLPPVAVTGVYAGIRVPLGFPSLSGAVSNLLIVIVLAIVGLAWARRGGLDQDRWFLLALGMFIALVFPWREQVAEPLAALLGFSAVGVLLFGLIWRLLSDAEFTRGDSPRFPGAARLLSFLSYAIFAAAAMLVVAYASPGSAMQVVDLDQLAGIGDSIIGFGLSIAVVVGLIELGRYGVDPDPEVEELEDLPKATA